jgi:hypothetical protein
MASLWDEFGYSDAEDKGVAMIVRRAIVPNDQIHLQRTTTHNTLFTSIFDHSCKLPAKPFCTLQHHVKRCSRSRKVRGVQADILYNPTRTSLAPRTLPTLAAALRTPAKLTSPSFEGLGSLEVYGRQALPSIPLLDKTISLEIPSKTQQCHQLLHSGSL